MNWKRVFLFVLIMHSSSVAALKVERSGRWIFYEQENSFLLMITKNERNHYLSYYCRLNDDQYGCEGVVSLRARCRGGDSEDFVLGAAEFSVTGKMACVAARGNHSRMFVFDESAFLSLVSHAEKTSRFRFTLVGNKNKEAMFYSDGILSALTRMETYLRESGRTNAALKGSGKLFVPRFPCIGSASFLPCQLRGSSPNHRGSPYNP